MSSSTRLGTARELAGVGVCAHKRLGPTQTPKLVADMRLCGARRAMWCRTQRKWLSSVTLDRGSCSSTLKKESLSLSISHRAKVFNILQRPQGAVQRMNNFLAYFLYVIGNDALMVSLCAHSCGCMNASIFGRRLVHACPTFSQVTLTDRFSWHLLWTSCYWLHDAPTSLTFKNRTLCPHFMCFIFIWEQTATCATYIINWLVFITEMKSVYCAVWTGSLNKAVCASSLKG